MTKKQFSKSVRKHIRKEKSRIRREVLTVKQQDEDIKKLKGKFLKKEPSSAKAMAGKEK